MKVAGGAGDFDLVVIESAQAVRDGRRVLRQHGSVGNNESVGLQFFLVLLHVIPKADAADFFFSFDQDFHVDGKLAVYFLQRFERLQMEVHLAFVVGSAAAEEISIADGGFERGRSPKLERLGRLNIIVPVKKNRRLARRFERFGIDERMEICRDDFNRFESCSGEMVRYPASGPLDIRLVFALGADTGNAEKFGKFREMLFAATLYKFSKVHVGRSEEMSPFQNGFVNCETNVDGSGMNREQRMTCRSRSPILGPPRVCAQANGFLATGHFLKCRPYDPLTQALPTSQIGT